MSSHVYVGTSGWYYRDWIGLFYPDKHPLTEMLSYYMRRFSTVELNASFYRLPFANMVKGWHDKAPEGFLFAVKGSRRITHLKRLSDADGEIATFFDRMMPLGERLGPILWQLPPSLRRNDALLDDFLGRLPRIVRHAVEFRHVSWFDPDVHAVLSRHRAALVSISSLQMPTDFTVTADFAYLRFHGLKGGFAHDYTPEELDPWAGHVRRQLAEGKTVFAYFNNDGLAQAPKNAQDLLRLIGEDALREEGRPPQGGTPSVSYDD